MAGGYCGKYCIIDLGSKTTEVVEPDEIFYQKFLGGYGLGAAVIMERQQARRGWIRCLLRPILASARVWQPAAAPCFPVDLWWWENLP